MTRLEFDASLTQSQPPAEMTVPLAGLWWDARGDWATAHGLVDNLETREGMAVHAYLHRKEGEASNADYWYARAGRQNFREDLNEERESLLAALLQP